MIPNVSVSSPPEKNAQFYVRDSDGALVALPTMTTAQRKRDAKEIQVSLLRFIAKTSRRDAARAATARQREEALRRVLDADRALDRVDVVLDFRPVLVSQPRSSRAHRSHRAAPKARDGDADSDGEPPAARAAWARIRAAQVALPVDRELARRLLEQAAQDLRGDAA